MKFFISIFILISFFSHSNNLKDVEVQYEIIIDGQVQGFKDGENKTLNINGKNVEVKLQQGEFKTFNNYGISFKIPKKTSGYLDETSEDLDIWNFDFHESVLMLMVLKNSDFDINEKTLTQQMEAISKSMGANNKDVLSVSTDSVLGVSSIGNIGEHRLLIEQYGFSNKNYKFLAFTYFPLKKKDNRAVSESYKKYKKTIFDSLVF